MISPLYVLLAIPALYYFLPYILDPHKQRSIPGPFVAAISNYWVAKAARSGKRYEVVEKAHRKYGTFVRIAPNNVSIADPDAIPLVYGHGTGTLKSNFYDAFVSIQRGLFNTRSRPEHTRKRKIVSAVFSMKNVKEFEPYIRESVGKLLKKWDDICENPARRGYRSEKGWSFFDCLPWFNFLAFDVIGDLAFGSPFGMLDREADIALVEDDKGKIVELPAVQILNQRGEYSATQGTIVPWLRPYMRYFDPWFARGLASVNNLAGIARNRVNKRLKEGAGDRKDLLSLLQAGKDEAGNPMPYKELTAEALTQLIAGSDTTSNSSCAITFWLAKNPEKMKKLQNELDEAFEAKAMDGVVEFEDCKDLPYLNGCINEALRCHSTSAIGLPRILQEPLEFKGHYFPAGSILSVPAYTVHHLESVWGDPWVYRPERWIEGDKDQFEKLDKAFIPFSYGPRSCVGRNLASMELLIFIATLFYRYDFILQDMTASELATSEGFLRKPLECFIGLRRRSPKLVI